jgi:hypothetical protein
MYFDPVNQAPKISPVGCAIAGSTRECDRVRRGDLLQLAVDFTDDGNRDRVSFAWKAFRCNDEGVLDCDDNAYDEQSAATAQIEVPTDTRGARAIRVDLQLRDERGAPAEQSPRYIINDAPTLELRPSAHSFVVGGPIELFAKYGDPDTGPLSVMLNWDVVAPVPSAVPLVKFDVQQDFTDLEHLTEGMMMVPDRTGDWDILVTASDGQGDHVEHIEKHMTFAIGADQPPCIAQAQPVVPPDGASLPVAEPTLFQVPLVTDDLDPYPPLSGNPHFGTTAFEWSILAPGSPGRQILAGTTGNTVDFDPDAFTPGDLVELRVEIFDRNQTAIPCTDSIATCSVNAQSACIQRQTWRLEVR